ncbi:NAD-dependent epimerase/dehydratase family protein [Paraburkholderia sp.]|uniref:NAD-dependent epimerase/dehydratase family protein n=1 Tax=Paraburkholderia sp. TaxID=1926495 RepID=UPI003D6F3EE1
MNIDKNLPVMVTGATGYVAGWLVKRLLDEGLTVHAPVRNPDDASKLKYLNEIAANAPGKIRYFKADLMQPGSYQEAMAGCQMVFHTASPFRMDVKDAQKELIEPAQIGTRNVLETVDRTPSVKRVVLTSSCAAIYGDSADLDNTPNGIFTEEIWNTSSSLKHQPYSYSKTLAEQEAWKIVKKQNRWDLVAINPSFVIGPGINPDGTSESFNIIRRMGDGTAKGGLPNIRLGLVDVRDVAEAHFRAAFTAQANGRYITSGHNSSFPEMASTLLDRYGRDYPIPRRTLPKWLVWLVGPIADKSVTRKMIARNVDRPWKADNSRSRNELGIRYRPLADSMNDFFQQFVEAGQFAK